MADVYQYTDYRRFLSDLIKTRKQGQKRISLGELSRISGAISKAYLSLVLNQKRNLSAKKVRVVGEAVGLEGARLSYFELLVRFNQAKSGREKEQNLERLLDARPKDQPRVLEYDQYTVLANWHPLILRELVRLGQVGGDYLATAKRLRGRMTPREVRRALTQLEQAKLIKKDERGSWVALDREVRSSDEFLSLAVQRYHQSCLSLAKSFLTDENLSDREFGSVNIAVHESDIPRLKEKLKKFRDELLAESRIGRGETSVCQINFQLLKLT